MKEEIQRFLEHAADALDAADILLKYDHELALANRVYYAIFYCVCALLLSKGVVTKKHEGARARFHELFIKTGEFDVEAGKLLARNFAARQSADYDMDTAITDEQARKLLDDARYFYSLTLAYFEKNPIS